MRIFNLNNVVTCALLDYSRPDLHKQSNETSYYTLNIYPYCKNGSGPKSIKSLRDTLYKLKVLSLQAPTGHHQITLAQTIRKKGFANITREVIAQKKKKATKAIANQVRKAFSANSTQTKTRSIKTRRPLVEFQFNISNPASSFPIFLLYKQKTSELVTQQELAELLNNYWTKLDANQIKNLALNKTVHKDQNENDLRIIIQEIFNEIEKRLSITILGIFLDPYFISKEDNKLIAENVVDKRYSRILEPTIDETYNQQESSISDKNKDCQTSTSNSLENLDLMNLQNQSNESQLVKQVILSTDSDSMKSNSDNPEKLFVLEGELTRPMEEISSDWNPETKEKINNLLLVYQKHLAKQYLFRSNEFTASKKFVTDDLLNKLEKLTFKEFLQHIFGISTTNIFNKHRDSAFIQKIGCFFKRHNETKGAQLLNNIITELNKGCLVPNILSGEITTYKI